MVTEVQQVINKWGNILVNTMKNKLVSGRKIATGNLVNSLVFKYSFNAGRYTIQITGEKYLINVDRGRRAGAKRPPIQAIINWINIKRIRIKVKKGQKRQDVVRGVAFAMSNKISQRGIKPFPILNLGKMITNSKQFQNEIKAAAKKDLLKAIKIP